MGSPFVISAAAAAERESTAATDRRDLVLLELVDEEEEDWVANGETREDGRERALEDVCLNRLAVLDDSIT